ncbi:MAG: Asp-tRNA(Asn)/Glu-tRNA(Gln) amidotransferase subunit GatA [Patescibacteria group bacterium]
MSKKLNELYVIEAKKLLEKKEISSVDIVNACINEIKNRNESLNAYLEVFDDCLDSAKAADTSRDMGNDGALLGIPLAIKDNILIKGKKVSAASRILEGYRATYDATAIKRLKDGGAIFLGRTNMDEFAMGGSTENSGFGVTKNPFDESRVPGGSSGGSASALASNMTLAALGTDTGGSVRQPASFCGIVGLKPTYGAISRYGIIAMGSSLDQIGPMTKTVGDAELIYKIISGRDELDSTTIEIKESKTKNNKIGVPWHFLNEGIDKDVLENFKLSLKKLESLGYEVKEVELPMIKYSLPVYYIIMGAESSTNLSRYDGVRYGKRMEGNDLMEDYTNTRALFGDEVKRRILLGTYVLSAGYYDAYYEKAILVREEIKKDFAKVFEEVDFIATPTAPTPAFKIGEKINDPVTMYLADIFTTPANITGLPALSLPSGFSKVDDKKLPLGIQFTGPTLSEFALFELGKKFLGEENV